MKKTILIFLTLLPVIAWAQFPSGTTQTGLNFRLKADSVWAQRTADNKVFKLFPQSVNGDISFQGQAAFLMTTFRQEDARMYIGLSNNGKQFKFLSDTSSYTAPTGQQVRDPSIIEYNNRYYITYSGGIFGGARFAPVMYSADLQSFQGYQEVPTQTTSGGNNIGTWAPEWYVNKVTGALPALIYTTTPDGFNHTMYYTQALNSSLTSWSNPIPITGTGLPNAIDLYIYTKPVFDGYYYLWYKNEDTKYIEIMRSTQPYSGYTVWKSGNWAGFGQNVEGVTIVDLGNGGVRVYFDPYNGGGEVGLSSGLQYSDSYDGFNTWTAPIGIDAKMTTRHGTVIRSSNLNLERNAINTLATKAGQPSSYTFFVDEPANKGVQINLPPTAADRQPRYGHFLGEDALGNFRLDVRNLNPSFSINMFNGTALPSVFNLTPASLDISGNYGLDYGKAYTFKNNFNSGLRSAIYNTPDDYLQFDIRKSGAGVIFRTWNGTGFTTTGVIDSIQASFKGSLYLDPGGAFLMRLRGAPNFYSAMYLDNDNNYFFDSRYTNSAIWTRIFNGASWSNIRRDSINISTQYPRIDMAGAKEEYSFNNRSLTPREYNDIRYKQSDVNGNKIWANKVITSNGWTIEKTPNGLWRWIHSDDTGEPLCDLVTLTFDGSGNLTAATRNSDNLNILTYNP